MSYGGGNGYADYGNGAGNGNGGQDWSGPVFFFAKKILILNSGTFLRKLKKAMVTAAVAMTLTVVVMAAVVKVAMIKDRIFQ